MAKGPAKNLLEVAHEEATLYQIIDSEEFYTEAYEQQMLQRLYEQAEALQLRQQTYQLLARTAIWLPRQEPQPDEVLPIELHYDERLTGRFESFRTFHLPLQGGAKWWRMLCVAFEDVTVQSGEASAPADMTVRVPILEMGTIACLGFEDGR